MRRRLSSTRRIPSDPSEYTSGNGISTDVFGPASWFLLYCIAANSPIDPSPTAKARSLEFLKSFQGILPCLKCRQSFCNHFRDIVKSKFRGDVLNALESRDAFFEFVYLLHNAVHRQQNKGNLPFTLRDARLTLESVRARDGSDHMPCRLFLGIKPKNVQNNDDHAAVNPFHIDPSCLLPLAEPPSTPSTSPNRRHPDRGGRGRRDQALL